MNREYTYYTDAQGIPKVQIIQRDGKGRLVSISGEMGPGSTIITEAEYDTLKAQHDQNMETFLVNVRAQSAARANRPGLRQSAIAKLVAGTPLNQDEAEAITT